MTNHIQHFNDTLKSLQDLYIGGFIDQKKYIDTLSKMVDSQRKIVDTHNLMSNI